MLKNNLTEPKNTPAENFLSKKKEKETEKNQCSKINKYLFFSSRIMMFYDLDFHFTRKAKRETENEDLREI